MTCLKWAQAVRALAAISKLIRSPEIRTHFKAPFCFQASGCTWFVGSSACLRTTVDSKKGGKKRKGKALQICGAGLAMERGRCFQPTDQTAAFVPIWDLLTNVFFRPGLTESAACYPFPVADSNTKLSQLLTDLLAHLFTNVKWKH